ncbi:MAG TPA: MSMEG_1061 family FMN-dependent PPOX-type flavoprotein [Ilumatobacteraceae bacterium]|nr:MSMEG_1061 family FMN-dependent PPOX-type flavoprotein [Ilumatobacteraceae bacterium]
MTDAQAPVGSIVGLDELAELYRPPSRIVAEKKVATLDETTVGFLAASPFALIGTVGVDGSVDVSPRGGPPGFIRALDDRHVAIPDLNGNNLIDTLRAIVATGRAGLLVAVPGKDETIRINGPAWVTTDASTLDLWNDELRRPTTAIVVRTDEVFMHCAKAFRRGRVWDPASWETLPDTPDRFDAATREWLENSYVAGLAADQPER